MQKVIFLAPKPDVEDVFSIKTVPFSDEYNDVLLYVINKYALLCAKWVWWRHNSVVEQLFDKEAIFLYEIRDEITSSWTDAKTGAGKSRYGPMYIHLRDSCLKAFDEQHYYGIGEEFRYDQNYCW